MARRILPHKIRRKGRKSNMADQAQTLALGAIHDEILKLLVREDISEEVMSKLELIESICRHEIDIRTEDEIAEGQVDA